MTPEAARRSQLVKAQLDRSRLLATAADEAAFIASLQVVSTAERLTPETATQAVLDRVRELIARTTQFNTTGAIFTVEDLLQVIAAPSGLVFTLRMRDRLSDHGLVGAAVVMDDEILNFVLSCRVIGLGGERDLLDAIIADARRHRRTLTARIVRTERNIPARHLYADHGFSEHGHCVWTMPPAPGVTKGTTAVLEGLASA